MSTIENQIEANLEDVLFFLGPVIADRKLIDAAIDAPPEELQAAKDAIEAKGQWNRVPAMGQHPDVWFHIPDILEGAYEPGLNDRTASEATLAACFKNRKRLSWHQIAGNGTQAEAIMTTARCHNMFIQHSIEDHRIKADPTSVQTVSMALATYYLPDAGFSLLSYKQVAAAAGCSTGVVRSAVAVLTKAGLWGVIKGTGQNQSRFYPLFIDRGLDEFELVMR